MNKTSRSLFARIMKTRRSSPSAAFTLIEMLTTVAIVAVLFALIAPNVSKGVESAKTSQCASNLRQIGVAMLNYAADNGRLPPGSGPSSWDKEIAPYLDLEANAAGKFANSKVFQCPADPKPNKQFQRSYTASRRGETGKPEGANKGVFGRPPNPADPTPAEESRRLSDIKYPSVAVLVAEKFEKENLQYGGSFNNTDGWLGEGGGQTHFDNDPKKPHYHRTGANYLFCDGHVELLSRTDILKGPWAGWRGGRWMVDQ